MKAVLISIQPEHVRNICMVIDENNGKPIYKKTVEVRKDRPKLETPFKCYIYCTHGKRLFYRDFTANVLMFSKHKYRERIERSGAGVALSGKVIGEFVCDSIRMGRADTIDQAYAHNNPSETCLTDQELVLYANFGEPLYFWHISDLKIYDKPKELREFYKVGKSDACVNGNRTCYYVQEDFCRECKYSIKQPPQSWGYVEV